MGLVAIGHRFSSLFVKGFMERTKLVLEEVAHATIKQPVGKSCYYDTHRMLHAESGVTVDLQNWEWAELDRHRVVWVEKGVLYAAGIASGGLGPAKVLYDFGPMEFEAIPAPY